MDTQAERHLPDAPTIVEAHSLAKFLRNPSLYPLFAKQASPHDLSKIAR